MQRPPAPSGQETIEALLDRSNRRELPIRWSFVQRGTRRAPQPGPLAELVHRHDERALDLYLLLHAAASAEPWNVDLPAAVWARMIDAPTGAISKTWRRLEERGLIARERVRRRASITLLREDGQGEAYTHPGGTAPRQPYLKLPYPYWRDGWHQRLSLAAKAMLLIALSLEDGFILPEERAPDWYGISADFAGDGLRALKKAGLLERERTYIKSNLSETGWTEEFHYTLKPPFGPRGRGRRPRRLRAATPTTAAEDAAASPVATLRRPRPAQGGGAS